MDLEPDPTPLSASFYRRETALVARELLGKMLRVRHGRRWRSGFIVEDEAYVRGDPANHAYRGPTRRNRSMFQGPGTIYVYRIHRVYCANVVTLAGEAVLIRAVEPFKNVAGPTDGPGKVCRALGITRERHDGVAATGPDIQILGTQYPQFELGVSTRVGVTKARDLALRFYIAGNPHVSR